MFCRRVVLLRGVTPNGKSKIPNMSYLAQVLEDAGFLKVKTYIQNGNVLLETSYDDEESKKLIHDIIMDKIGADLSVILKTAAQLQKALDENPFKEGFDQDRVHLVFTNDIISQRLADKLTEEDFSPEIMKIGSECIYLYLPKECEKKKLSSSFLERNLRITATARKIKVIIKLLDI